MTLLSRAGWVLCAVLFATLLSSVLHVDHAGWLPNLLLAAFAVFACVWPHRALIGLLAVVPVVGLLTSQVGGWNASLAWAEALACAALTGFAVDAARRGARTPGHIAAPALLLGALVLASLIAGIGVLALRFGPAFTQMLVSQLTREYFTDIRTFPALHAGMLLLEGTLLAVHGARLAAERPIAMAAARALAIGGALSATCTAWQLLQAAWQRPSFVAAIRELVGTGRWNVHYGDHNAAGSYYAMAVLVGAALVWRERGAARIAWAACTALIAVGLWLTSSRTAVLAVPAAVVAAFLVTQLAKGGRAALVRVAAIAAAACGVLVLVAVMLPQRGIQQGVGTSTDVRIGLIQTGLRMIRTHPVFGLGLGEFSQRAGEFSTQDLIDKFPVAGHENAHNNFIQVAAELGIPGGIFFTWIVVAALLAQTLRAIAAHDRFQLLVAAGVSAFALTMLGGHPLLIPAPAYMFWAMAGIAAGHPPSPRLRRAGVESADGERGAGRIALAAVLIAIVATVPWRMRALERDANLEHVGINVSPLFQSAPDGTRYREAPGWATLFVPAGAFKLSINVRGDRPTRLEVRLDGRIADVKTVAPGTWFDLSMLARTERATARFARLDLRLLDASEAVMWVTKVQPLQ